MNALEKFRYLGWAQTFRKYALKAERAAKGALIHPPAVPLGDPDIELHLELLGQSFDLRVRDRWHRTPDTGHTWPLTYGLTIPLDHTGDVKFIWELNRHQFLPELARTDPQLARRILRDWVTQNPFEFGINWNNALEVSLRLIAWLETFAIAPKLQPEFRGALNDHALFIEHNLSADWIPRGNHLLGEAAALSVFHRKPHPALRQAVTEQFYSSGVHREQSVAYHHFVTHLCACAGLPQPKALAYLGAIRQPDGSLPDIGDNDSGRASSQPLELPAPPCGSVAFPDVGHYVIRQDSDYCFIRCGEFGLPPNCAHSHADLLSPILWLRGEPVFIDPGTFTYNGDPQLRRQFRTAHNTLLLPQADPTGTFSWTNPQPGICESWNETEFVGTVGPWRRRIQYDTGQFRITDTAPAGQLRWQFHLHPNLKVTRCTAGEFVFGKFSLKAPGQLRVGTGWYSPAYGQRVPIDVCEISMDASTPVTAEFVVQ
ncbi:MAG: alginate lyase family protein [Verrucomicrobiota bacterium]